jgi:hypothetical protein
MLELAKFVAWEDGGAVTRRTRELLDATKAAEAPLARPVPSTVSVPGDPEMVAELVVAMRV